MREEINMANENPNYYAIIPASVRYNEELSFLEKFLYCEFTALSNLNGYCIAKNKYFAELYDKDEKTISRAISRLEELGFIRLEYEKTGARVTNRRIYLTDQKSTSDKIVNRTEITGDKNITREQEKFLLTSDKIVKENNSSYNTLLSLILDYYKEKDKEKEKSFSASHLEIFDYWNSKDIIKHKELTDVIDKAITKALKTYSVEQIKEYIDRYNTVIKDNNYYFDTKWSLDLFITQKNAIPDFTDEGSKWLNYRDKKQQLKSTNARQASKRNYSKEELNSLFTKLN